MVKISGNNSGTVCGRVTEDVGLEKTNAKQASASNEIQYLAFIALKNITVGREPPPEPEERRRDYPRYAVPEPNWPPKDPEPRPKKPPCCACYRVSPPKDTDIWKE